MKHKIKKLSHFDSSIMTANFLDTLGARLKSKRLKKNLSQEELAYCLDIDQATLSRYEKGADMNVSMLPLFSTYCSFPMYELFPKDESKAILDTFSKAVKITVAKRIRQDEKQAMKEQATMDEKPTKILKAKIYEVDGQEVYEEVKQKPKQTIRKMYRDAAMPVQAQPYTDEDIPTFYYEYMQDTSIIESVTTAGQFLEQTDDVPKMDTLKCEIADYVIDKMVLDLVTQYDDEQAQRLYAYYKQMYMKEYDTIKGNNNHQ